MKTDEIIRQIEENGGLDMRYIRRASSNDNVSVRKYLTDMVRANYNCSKYVAKNVAFHYC